MPQLKAKGCSAIEQWASGGIGSPVGASVGPALDVDGSNNFPSRFLLAAVSKDIPCSLLQLSH